MQQSKSPTYTSCMTTPTNQSKQYLSLLEGRDAVEVMAETPGRLGVLLDGVTLEQAEKSPAPGKWSLRELMAHLADSEIAWSWRMRQVFSEDNPNLQPFDQDRWAKVYPTYTFKQAFSTWKALRAWNLEFLRGLSAADRARPATHPEVGEMTLWSIARIAAGHDLHHLRALEAAGAFWR
jgi:uncharacterized damage-inducible protein DinB